MALSAHREMYLKAILALEKRHAKVRAKDLAEVLGLSRPSVTKAVAGLVRDGYVSHLPYLDLALTAKGRQAARTTLRRHQVLREFLTRVLGVKPKIADEEACAMEHVVSRETLQAAADFLAFLEHCPKGSADLLRHFREVSGGKASRLCGECGLERLKIPALPEPVAHVARQHSRF